MAGDAPILKPVSYSLARVLVGLDNNQVRLGLVAGPHRRGPIQRGCVGFQNGRRLSEAVGRARAWLPHIGVEESRIALSSVPRPPYFQISSNRPEVPANRGKKTLVRLEVEWVVEVPCRLSPQLEGSEHQDVDTKPLSTEPR